MRRSKISTNIYNWATSLKGLALLALVIGIILCVVDMSAGPFVLASCIPLYLAGVFAAPLGVMAEAANKYLEDQEKKEKEEAESVQ